MSFVFDVLPSLVKTANDLYDFGQKIYRDSQEWQDRKEKKKLKQIITDLRNLIGSIDKIYSELLLLDRISEIDKQQYDQNKEKFEKIYDNIQDTRNNIYCVTLIDYFYDYPELRDVLFIKLGRETMPHPDQPEPKSIPKPSESLDSFKYYVQESSETTRKALIAMNKHLAENFN